MLLRSLPALPALLLFLLLPPSLSFLPPYARSLLRPSFNLQSTPKGSSPQPRPEPTPNDIAIYDEMIDKLSMATIQELPTAVSAALKVVGSPSFFMRIAERSDMTTSTTEKDRLSSLASNLSATLQAVVSTSEKKLNDASTTLQKVLASCAEPSGEFIVPLTQKSKTSLKSELQNLPLSNLDETFVSTLDSYMNKASKDDLPGLVFLLQTAMQYYAGIAISSARRDLINAVAKNVAAVDDDVVVPEESSCSKFFTDLIVCEREEWGERLKDLPEGVDLGGLSNEAQKTIESVVLGLENGSVRQRVWAEYLREIVNVIEELRRAEEKD